MIANNNVFKLSIVGGLTVIALTALVTSSGGRFDGNWNKDGGSITIESKPTLLKANDCLPSGESSHISECNNR